MRIEISSVLAEEHHYRLRAAAQAPSRPLIVRFWATLTRRQTAQVARIEPRELERLAA